MVQSQIIGNEFYQSLGKLFYSIACADKSVHAKELDKLKSFIRKYWLDVDEMVDEYGEDAAFQIETVFDWLLEYEKDAKSSYEDFEAFYKAHEDKFNSYIKVLILDTANAIANAAYGKNKAELIALARLQMLMV
ncbi:hypothetical protein [Flagellimonas allohymeniacidonis]|uniref:Co-chaperone DjlA N-terminal domain-containing protein n=1 Tax=Flagellimonas allohymeniacidonis TaxID=2517819 RepID=A0A4V2HT04_9FLAO|nr:hypothetical protein [Allomuricauda hymeniacidonis]TAI49740.1 hypothetical protein EW142_08065 [Allomuricauda hymeniacidonis]